MLQATTFVVEHSTDWPTLIATVVGDFFVFGAVVLAGFALREARQTSRELRRATEQLHLAVTTLHDVLSQTEQAAATDRQASSEARLHRRIDRLAVIGKRIEELASASVNFPPGLRHIVVREALSNYKVAIAVLGGEVDLPACASLARQTDSTFQSGGEDIPRGEIQLAISAAHQELRNLADAGV